MNWDRIEGNWKEFGGQARTQWGELSDDDVAATGGQRDALIGKVQSAYGLARDVAERQVREWSEKLSELDLAGTLSQAQSTLGRTLDSAKQTASEWTADATGAARTQAERLRQRAAERPLVAIGIAFALGYVVMRLMRGVGRRRARAAARSVMLYARPVAPRAADEATTYPPAVIPDLGEPTRGAAGIEARVAY